MFTEVMRCVFIFLSLLVLCEAKAAIAASNAPYPIEIVIFKVDTFSKILLNLIKSSVPKITKESTKRKAPRLINCATRSDFNNYPSLFLIFKIYIVKKQRNREKI